MHPVALAIILAAAVIILAAIILRRGGRLARASGEICFRAGLWECSACGEIVPMKSGEQFRRCEGRAVEWNPVQDKRGEL